MTQLPGQLVPPQRQLQIQYRHRRESTLEYSIDVPAVDLCVITLTKTTTHIGITVASMYAFTEFKLFNF